MSVELRFHHKDFETAIRDALNIHERPVLDTDAALLNRLECDSFYFDEEDCEVLKAFCNLQELFIEGGAWLFPTISTLTKLKTLYLTGGCDEIGVDFRNFLPLKELEDLTVSGGDWSSMNLCHLEALKELKNLTSLALHEFGNVDLKPLESLTWLRRLFCGYACTVANVEIISKLVNLEYLELVDFEVEDLHFVEALPETTELSIGGMRIRREYDLTRLERFRERDIQENIVAGEWIP